MNNKLKAVCFGEVLFDNFPTHSKIGGAPLNVSSRLRSLGTEVSVISAVGTDVKGKRIIKYLQESKIDTSGILVKNDYPTGEVNVVLNDKGIASYDITYPAAWDKISISNNHVSLVQKCDIFVYGSLICRDSISRSALELLLANAKYKVFDVNLRAPHYTNKLLVELMEKANFIKFNDDELFEIAEHLGSKYNSMEQTIEFVAEITTTDTICVTKGAYGAILYTNKKFYYNSGYRVKVLDTVGSGDSFLASVLYKLFTNAGFQEAIDFGCAVGAMVACNEGANPVLTEKKIAKFMNP
ncbi:fructokinase [Flavobacteriaceae bacterium MAR_2009_75]|nr:fructokinase [Flavobacteriaceae bacterium MAR_2009_75]